MKRLLLMVLCLLLVGIMMTSTVAATDEDDEANTAGFAFAGLCCTVFLIVLVINILILLWVYKDANARGVNATLWLLVVLVGGIIGLIIWLIVRPPLEGHRPPPNARDPYGPPPGYDRDPYYDDRRGPPRR